VSIKLALYLNLHKVSQITDSLLYAVKHLQIFVYQHSLLLHAEFGFPLY